MERLSGVQELLDGPLDDRSTLVGNLRDLRRANRWLGGARLSIRAVEAIAAQPDGGPAGDDPAPGRSPSSTSAPGAPTSRSRSSITRRGPDVVGR